MVFVLTVLGILFIAIGRASRRQHARMLETPAVNVAHAQCGRVSLQGRASGEPPKSAPITGRLSAYWEAELWDVRWSRNRLPMAKEQSTAPVIWVEDDSGRIPVLLHGVEWVFADEDELNPGKPISPEAKAFVERHSYAWESNHVRLRERRLEEGAPVYVHGVVARVADLVPVLANSQNSSLARAVSALSKLNQPGSRVDLASYLRGRFEPAQLIVWCERRPLVIGNRARATIANRMRWIALTCNITGIALLTTAGILLLLAIAAW